jgi:hypothetical protein
MSVFKNGKFYHLLNSFRNKEPEIVFDASRFRTREDWIQAGNLVFESDIQFRPAPAGGPVVDDPSLPVGKDGELPFLLAGLRYDVRRKGVLEIGINACANCHTRVMPDGSFLEGAQGIVDRPSLTLQPA